MFFILKNMCKKVHLRFKLIKSPPEFFRIRIRVIYQSILRVEGVKGRTKEINHQIITYPLNTDRIIFLYKIKKMFRHLYKHLKEM